MADRARSDAGGRGAGGRLTRRRRAALLEVALIAQHLHWSRADILALPLSEHRALIEILKGQT